MKQEQPNAVKTRSQKSPRCEKTCSYLTAGNESKRCKNRCDKEPGHFLNCKCKNHELQ